MHEPFEFIPANVDMSKEFQPPAADATCPRCGGPLHAFWLNGQVDSIEEPMFFCGPCFQATGEEFW